MLPPAEDTEDSQSTRIPIKEAAEMLGVSTHTLRRWDKEGRLRPSGKSTCGWRYYLITDIRQVLSDICLASSVSKNTPAYHLPIKVRKLSPKKRNLLKSRAEEIAAIIEKSGYQKISLLVADMVHILEATESEE